MKEEIHIGAIGFGETNIVVCDLGYFAFVKAARNCLDVNYLSFETTKEIFDMLMHNSSH